MKKAKILIVEDESIIAKDVRHALERLGYAVTAAASTGEEAIEEAVKSPPDLVLMDIKLKGELDGIDAAQRIQARFDVPLVYLTAYADETTLRRAKITEPFGYVLKPFEERELHSAIEIALHKHDMERRLRESEKRFRSLIENASDTIMLLDSDGTMRYVSPSVKRILGYDPEGLVGRSIFECLHPEDTTRIRHLVNDVVRGQEVFHLGEARFRHKDGSWRCLESVGNNRLEDPVVQGVVVNSRDVTERKQMEERLRQQEQLAAVGQLAAGIAHDFRNTLTTILLYTDLALRQPGLPSSVTKGLGIIMEESKGAAAVVDQILDFSSCALIERRPLDLASFVGEMLEVLRRKIPEDVELALAAEPEERLGAFMVRADSSRMQQVVTNLTLNARDAMPSGGEVRFEVSCIEVAADDTPPVADMEPGAWVCLAVSDTGSGMTKEVQAHLFEPFFTTKEVGRGTGLGLAQVYGIVRQHEGHIAVETQPGRGTTFRIYLPGYRGEGPESEDEDSPAAPLGCGETILLVEDDRGVREAGLGILESLGYQVLTAANGCEALAVYEAAGTVDLVIADIVMPGMSASALVRELRRSAPNLKVLGITGYAAHEVTDELREAGFVDLVQKPFDLDAVAQAVRQALDKRVGRWK